MNIEVKIKELFNKLNIYCVAIYKGGSRLDPIINNPHDYDYICFAKDLQRHHLARFLIKNGFKATPSKKFITTNNTNNINIDDENLFDFSQIRVPPYTQITWFSYLDILMERVIGEEVCPKTDIIYEYRLEFYQELYNKMIALQENKIGNQKRWYHLLRGIYILINNSYEVTEEQKKEINILHDLSEGWEKVRDKTIQLITNFNNIDYNTK